MGRWTVAAAAIIALAFGLALPLKAPLLAQPAKGHSERPVAVGDPLGVADKGIFSDLDDQIRIDLPEGASAENVRAVVDRERGLLVLYVDDWPTKPYPLVEGGAEAGAKAGAGTGRATLTVGDISLPLRPADRRELAPLLTAENTSLLPTRRRKQGKRAGRARTDRDGDGIPDALDLLMGAHKTAINRASYGAGYIKLTYPMGDVPRDRGVCTDVIVRAARNAGLDIQVALHRDIKRSPRSYPMVTGTGNRNIDHRRVKTLLPYFKRHWNKRATAIDDPDDPLRPGDILFMDTFPNRSGPDHIGIVSNRVGASGHPLIINNWTDGTVTAEMDLLGWVPVTQRFRF